METRLLRTFAAVVRSGSISAAALELGYVQSSVSEQLRRLEAELDATLFHRTSTGVQLTADGRRLLPEAQRVLASVQRLQRVAQAPGRVRLGALDTLALHWLGSARGPLASVARPSITMNRRDRLLGALLQDECDVVVLYRAPGAALPALAGFRTEALDVEVLGTDRLVVVASPDHPMDVERWLITEPGCLHREMFERHVAFCDDERRIEAPAPTPEGLRRLARLGVGRALLPRLAVAGDLTSGELVVVPPTIDAALEIIAVHHPDPSEEITRLVETVMAADPARWSS